MVKQNGLAAIAYVFGILSGILVFLVADKKDKLARFHGAQSIFFNIFVLIISAVLGLISAFAFGGFWMFGVPAAVPLTITAWVMIGVWVVFGLAVFITWLFLVLKAYSGQKHKLPLIGNIAESLSG